MMHGISKIMATPIVGILIASLNVLAVVGTIVFRILEWRRTRPQQVIRGIGIRYLPGSKPDWPGMSCVIDGLYSKLTPVYGEAFVDDFLSHIIIEVVPADGSRATPTTVVSRASRVAGSIASERQFPWTRPYDIAVVLQLDEYYPAGKAAISHEIVKHILPFRRGEGLNNDHSRKDLNDLSAAIDAPCCQ